GRGRGPRMRRTACQSIDRQRRGCPRRYIPKPRRGREPHRRRGCMRSRARLPALFTLALQTRTRRGRGKAFAAIKGGEAPAKFLVEFRQWADTGRIVLLEKPQCFPDDLARRVVPARFHFGGDEFLQVRGERDI